MVTVVSGRGGTCKISLLWSHFSPFSFLFCTVQKKVTIHSPHLKSYTPFLKDVTLIHLVWNSSAQEIFLFSTIYLFSNLLTDRKAWCVAVHEVAKSRTQLSDWTELNVFISIWTLGYFTYVTVQMFQLWTLRALLVGPVSLWHTLISVGFCCFGFVCLFFFFFSTSFLALEGAPGSSCIFPVPDLKSSISSRNPCSF